MRLAVFGDVHGNLAALDTVLEDIRRHAPERIVCLGDLVGYATVFALLAAVVRAARGAVPRRDSGTS